MRDDTAESTIISTTLTLINRTRTSTCQEKRICSSSGFASSTTRSPSPSYSSSPVKVSVYSGGQSQFSTTPVRLSVDPRRSVSSATKRSNNQIVVENVSQKTSCMCSPSTHPGAFRCRMHKHAASVIKSSNVESQNTASSAYARLFVRRSAVTNSLAILGVEGEMVRRALASLVRPAEARRPSKRGDFVPRPSRLSKMSRAEDI